MHQRGDKLARRLNSYDGQHETLPIKDTRQLQEFMYNLLRKKDRAKTPIKKYQADRNWMMCLLGFNTALRAEDLLQLRVLDVKKGYIHIKENKTGKMQNFRMNKQLHNDVLEYIERNGLGDYDYLFKGQKKKQNGKPYYLPITRQRAYNIVEKNGEEVGIDFTFGVHSLRKTFGYMYINAGGKLNTLMKMYNHDDPNVTMKYICWGREDAEADRQAIYLGGVHK